MQNVEPGQVPDDLMQALAQNQPGAKAMIEVVNYQFALVDMDAGQPDADGCLPRAMLFTTLDGSMQVIVHLPPGVAEKIGKTLLSTPAKRASGLVVPGPIIT
jgi:hypothetical protein